LPAQSFIKFVTAFQVPSSSVHLTRG